MAVTVADLVARISLDTNGIDRGAQNLDARLGRVSNGLKETGRYTRVLASQLAGELSPALGNVVQSATAATAVAGGLSLKMGLVVTAVVAAAAAMGQLVRASNDAIKAQAQFNLALRGGDIGGLRGQLQERLQILEEYRISQQGIIGRFIDWLRTHSEGLSFFGFKPFHDLFGQNVAQDEAARLQGGIAKLLPAEIQSTLAKTQLAEIGDRRADLSAGLGRAERQFDLEDFDTFIIGMKDLLAVERQLEQVLAQNNAELKKRAAIGRNAKPEELAGIDKDLALQLSGIQSRFSAGQVDLGERAIAGRTAISIGRRERSNPVFDIGEPGAADPEFIKAQIEAAQKPLSDLQLRLQGVEREAKLMGNEFDRVPAELEAVKRAILDFNPAVANASQRLKELNDRFEQLRTTQRFQEAAAAGFAGLREGLHSAVDGLITGLGRLDQAFAQIGRSIAASLIHNVVDQGIKVVQEALNDFIRQVAEKGLARALLGIVGKSAAGAATSGLGPTGGVGVEEGLQHGGVVTGGQMRLVGEGGPEAVIPLRDGRVPVMLSGGSGGVIVNVITPPGHNAEVTDGRGPNGETVKNVVIRAIRQSVATGEFDGIMATYGGRRQGATR